MAAKKKVDKTKAVEKKVAKTKAVEKKIAKSKAVEKKIGKSQAVEKKIAKAIDDIEKGVEGNVIDVASLERSIPTRSQRRIKAVVKKVAKTIDVKEKAVKGNVIAIKKRMRDQTNAEKRDKIRHREIIDLGEKKDDSSWSTSSTSGWSNCSWSTWTSKEKSSIDGGDVASLERSIPTRSQRRIKTVEQKLAKDIDVKDKVVKENVIQKKNRKRMGRDQTKSKMNKIRETNIINVGLGVYKDGSGWSTSSSSTSSSRNSGWSNCSWSTWTSKEDSSIDGGDVAIERSISTRSQRRIKAVEKKVAKTIDVKEKVVKGNVIARKNRKRMRDQMKSKRNNRQTDDLDFDFSTWTQSDHDDIDGFFLSKDELSIDGGDVAGIERSISTRPHHLKGLVEDGAGIASVERSINVPTCRRRHCEKKITSDVGTYTGEDDESKQVSD